MMAGRLGLGLVLLLMVGVLRADQAEDRAVQVVKKLGGEITRDQKAPGQPVTRVDLVFTAVTDRDLKELAPLKNLKKLGLAFTDVTDGGVKELAAFPQLESLDLSGTLVTDAGLKELAGLMQLRKLLLIRTKVTPAGIRALKQALPQCEIFKPR
jgi:hypothetical protein